MNRLRVYVDTSVIGGCLDVEFAHGSRKLLERISRDIAGMTFEEEKAYIRDRLKRAREREQTTRREHAA